MWEDILRILGLKAKRTREDVVAEMLALEDKGYFFNFGGYGDVFLWVGRPGEEKSKCLSAHHAYVGDRGELGAAEDAIAACKRHLARRTNSIETLLKQARESR